VTGTSPNLNIDFGIPAGAAGAQGTTGANGSNGINSFTVTTASFTQPAFIGSVSPDFAEIGWAVVNQIIFIGNGGGYYRVVGKIPATPGYVGPGQLNLVRVPTTYPSAGVGSPIPSGSAVSPAGEPGTDGIQGIQGPAASPGTQGPIGPAGGNGTNGTRTFNFPGVPPVPSLVGANVGDYMIDTVNRVMYNWPAAVPNAWSALFSLGGGVSTLNGFRGSYSGAAPVTIPAGGTIASNWTTVTFDTTDQTSPIANIGGGGAINLVGAQVFSIDATATFNTGASRAQQAIRIRYRTGSGWNVLTSSVAYYYTPNTFNDLVTMRTSATFNASAVSGFTGEIRIEVSADAGVLSLSLINTANSINITAVQ
jgi:hypothetical protein